MSRIRIAWSLPGLALLLALGWAGWVWWFNFGGTDQVAEPLAASTAGPAASAERGAYLARAGNCMTCHTERGGAAYAGGRAIDTPFGTVYAGNITPDRETGIGDWTSGDFWRALHHGRSRDGRLLVPAFPYPNYTLVTRADADALHAFLRTQAPVRRANTPHALRWPYSTQAALAVWRSLYFRPGTYRDEPARAADWNRGAYLVRGLGHCAACHAPRNALGASSDMMDLSGGLIPMQNWYAPSLSAPDEAGVAGWKAQHIVQLLRTGVAPGAVVTGPMADVVLHSTQHLDEADLQAIASYLQALPQAPAPSRPAESQPVGSRIAERGSRLYADHCAQCHGEQGRGVDGAYPALAGNRAVTLHASANLVQTVLGGGFAPATAGNPRPFGMPPYATVLSDADVAAVLTHIRGAWGNRAAPVSELDVARQRGSTRP